MYFGTQLKKQYTHTRTQFAAPFSTETTAAKPTLASVQERVLKVIGAYDKITADKVLIDW